jgi:aryl-alcohol dehydrogenase-like predicted oxidoreductase
LINPLPRVVLGTLPFGSVVSKTESQLLVEHALEGGIRGFDVSHLYGGGEASSILRGALAGVSDAQIWCSIGLDQRDDRRGVFAVQLAPMTEREVLTRTYDSLESLGASKLALLNIHGFDESTPLETTLRALQSLKEAGTVERVSYANLSIEQAKKILSNDQERVVDLVQLHGNLVERRLLETSGAVFRADERQVACFRPFARGLLTREYSLDDRRPSDSRASRGWRLDSYLTDSFLAELGQLKVELRGRGFDPVGAALSWLLIGGPADVAVVGVRESSQLEGILSWLKRGGNNPGHDGIEGLIRPPLREASYRLPLDHFER